MHEIPEHKRKALLALGFGAIPDAEDAQALRSPCMALATPMTVSGDHADDVAYLYYAKAETDKGVLEGFFYSPSLLEGLLLAFGGQWSPERMLRELNRERDCEIDLVFAGGYPFFFTELTDMDFDENLGYHWLRITLGDMYKLIGQLDYLLPRKRRALIAKKRKTK